VRSEDRYAPFNDDKLYRLASIRRRSGGLFAREALYGREIKTKVLKEIREGDFIISRMQVVHGALGVVPSDFDRFYVSDSYEVLVLRDPASLDMGFFNYLSQTPAFYRLALVSSHGVHIEKMTFGLDDFLNEKVLVPPTIEEQRHISALLKESDDEISLLEKRSDALKEQKSGLMNRLLSGKIRLKR
jgi:type I restriction enzyme S subunit